MSVSIWQDVNVNERDHEAAPPTTRTVATVDMLKAMADPTRIAILTVLMEHPSDLPVMSVKEIAARLGEPQTKLYRHIKQLEAAGLIKVAATRMVSGILEQRYQAAQQRPGVRSPDSCASMRTNPSPPSVPCWTASGGNS